jgi:diacylglycerol kinase
VRWNFRISGFAVVALIFGVGATIVSSDVLPMFLTFICVLLVEILSALERIEKKLGDDK